MATKRVVKPWVKVSYKVLGVAAIVGGLYWLAGVSGVLPDKSEGGGSLFKKSDDKVIVFSSNTFQGFMPWVLMNNGLEPNEECPLYKDYGIKLKILIQDDFDACRKGLMNGSTNIVYGTLDSYPVEMGEGGDMANSQTKFFNLSNWSVGSDAIVCNSRINTVTDLIGKTVCTSKGTASHTLLLNALEAAGIGPESVNDTEENMPDKVNVKYCDSGIDAGRIFRAGQIDAAVVYSPEDEDIIRTMRGTKVLVSTKQASNIICDGLIAKKAWLEENREDVKKLLACLLWANSEMNNNPEAVKRAAKLFSENYDYTYDLALECAPKVRFVTLEDERNFFGLNTDFNGMTGSELYSKMARTYSRLGLCQSPLSWNKVSDSSFIEELIDEGSVKGDQRAEEQKTFTAPTKELETAQEMSSKKLSIVYPTNSSTLDNNAKALIDREFVSIAKQFSGSRIRIEGNTDDTGSDAVNIPLSKSRAQAAADYLVKEYGFDRNRFIVIGNGSKKAKADGVTGSNEAYRTTDFELINE